MMESNPETCIICLNDNLPVINYKNVCNCHPSIHIDCINKWYEINPNTCPICLITYEPIENKLRYFYLCSGIILCCSPLISLITLLIVYNTT